MTGGIVHGKALGSLKISTDWDERDYHSLDSVYPIVNGGFHVKWEFHQDKKAGLGVFFDDYRGPP